LLGGGERRPARLGHLAGCGVVRRGEETHRSPAPRSRTASSPAQAAQLPCFSPGRHTGRAAPSPACPRHDAVRWMALMLLVGM
jgi:hypothetical protein